MENSTSNNGLEKFQNIYFTVRDDLGSNKEIYSVLFMKKVHKRRARLRNSLSRLINPQRTKLLTISNTITAYFFYTRQKKNTTLISMKKNVLGN